VVVLEALDAVGAVTTFPVPQTRHPLIANAQSPPAQRQTRQTQNELLTQRCIRRAQGTTVLNLRQWQQPHTNDASRVVYHGRNRGGKQAIHVTCRHDILREGRHGRQRQRIARPNLHSGQPNHSRTRLGPRTRVPRDMPNEFTTHIHQTMVRYPHRHPPTIVGGERHLDSIIHIEPFWMMSYLCARNTHAHTCASIRSVFLRTTRNEWKIRR
jgi:hypothetical protein